MLQRAVPAGLDTQPADAREAQLRQLFGLIDLNDSGLIAVSELKVVTVLCLHICLHVLFTLLSSSPAFHLAVCATHRDLRSLAVTVAQSVALTVLYSMELRVPWSVPHEWQPTQDLYVEKHSL